MGTQVSSRSTVAETPDAAVTSAMMATAHRRGRKDVAACTGDGRVVSSHVTSEGLVVYVRCACGGIRIVQVHVR